MKRVITLFAAVMLLSTLSFAQQNMTRRHVNLTKSERMVAPRLTLPVAQTIMPTSTKDDTPITTFPWTEDFESGVTPTNFTYIDADNDSYCWTVYDFGTTANGHNGSLYVITSASFINNLGPLTPDNWMVLPAFTLPTEASDFELTWYEKGQDANYAEEYYSVYICTTGHTVDDFTATTAVLTSTATGSWVKKTVDLSSYAGQTIHIAFRHYNVTDMFYLDIDDIRVGGPTAPEVTLYGPVTIERNVEVTFTATGANTFAWKVDDTELTETDTTINYTFTTVGQHTVIASATNSVGTGSDTLIVEVFSCDEAITAMPWNEDFEGNTDCWHFLTPDGISDGFVINESGYGHHGSDFCLVGTWSDDVDVDQWAISPRVTLPAEATDYILKYYVFTNEYDGIQSHYQVYVTTELHPTVSDFTTPLVNETSATGDYAPHTVALGAYAGQTIRIAFHNITPQEGDAMFIDDLYIGVPLAPDMTLYGSSTVRTNEPVTFEAVTDATTIAWTVDGATVSSTDATMTHTFTSAGMHTIIAAGTNTAGTTRDTLEVEAVDCPTYSLPHNFNLATEYNICWDNPEYGWDTILMDDGNYYLYSVSNMWGIFDLDPDNWLYTPALTMPASGNFEVAWKVMPYTTELPSDHYGVYVVKGDNATLLYHETLTANITAPSQRAVAIPQNVTGDFKLAIRHYNTSGGYAIMISNLAVVSTGSTQGIENVANTSVAVYPNPANDVLNIAGEGILQVELMDVNGRTVMNAYQAGSLNIGSLTSGVYVVRVITADGVSTQKIVKK